MSERLAELSITVAKQLEQMVIEEASRGEDAHLDLVEEFISTHLGDGEDNAYFWNLPIKCFIDQEFPDEAIDRNLDLFDDVFMEFARFYGLERKIRRNHTNNLVVMLEQFDTSLREHDFFMTTVALMYLNAEFQDIRDSLKEKVA